MREIKFRYVFKKPNGHIVLYFTDIQHLEHGDIADFLQHNFLSIERDLISRDEFTGLKDKNGKEIYEGDIFQILLEPEEINAVTFESGCWMLSEHGLDLIDWFGNGEVIGNIWENKELLNDSK